MERTPYGSWKGWRTNERNVIRYCSSWWIESYNNKVRIDCTPKFARISTNANARQSRYRLAPGCTKFVKWYFSYKTVIYYILPTHGGMNETTNCVPVASSCEVRNDAGTRSTPCFTRTSRLNIAIPIKIYENNRVRTVPQRTQNETQHGSSMAAANSSSSNKKYRIQQKIFQIYTSTLSPLPPS